MRKLFFNILFFLCALANSQNVNIVQNPSFEDTLWCMSAGNTTVNKFNYVYNVTNSTPDAFHFCNDFISPNLIYDIKRHSGYVIVAENAISKKEYKGFVQLVR